MTGALLLPLLLIIQTATAPLPGPLEAGWRGEAVCERLTETAQLRTLRCTFPPGVGHERHFHAPHWGYVLQGGTMRITDANGVREMTLATGGNWSSEGTA